MPTQNHEAVWSEVKELWGRSAKSEAINFEVKALVDELKQKMSPLEKQLVNKDFQFIKNNTSQLEKELINKDMELISSSLKKFIQLFKK
ncbi:MAG: hypothetical protein OQK04_04920 [Kangiellaceae bacterium]|nr:hypothetical protein [Kangiellaceae bacterium]MCW8998037.1 hypothetical protein [Kangiellaceae bacterium]